MTTTIGAEFGVAQVSAEVGVRVGMLLGRYLDDPALVSAVADHVTAGWLSSRAGGDGLSSVDDVWNDYVTATESTVGGADCATDDDLGGSGPHVRVGCWSMAWCGERSRAGHR